MKKLLVLLTFLALGFTSFGQTLKLKFTDPQVNTNINGQPINKGDQFDVWVNVNPNNNTTTRSLYFDFEFQNTAFELVSITHTDTGGNGGVIPYGSQITFNNYSYPGNTWYSTQQNSVEDGNVRYQYANYQYSQNKTILRAYLSWVTQTGTSHPFYEGKLLKLRFRLKTDAPGYVWDPIRMNFAAAYNQNGSNGSTIMENPLASVVLLDPIATSYVNAKIEMNNNLSQYSLTRVAFVDSLTNEAYLVDATSTGKLNIDQARLKANTTYKVMMMVNMDSMYDLYNAAVTVSDYTISEAEFISQNLDGTFKNQNIRTGMGYFAADINRNKVFDGGDITKIFAQSVSVDQLLTLPNGYQPGQDNYMSMPTFTEDQFNALTPETWKNITVPYVLFKTGNIGTNLPLNLKYVLWGDINRSHSSQVIVNNIVQTSAMPSYNQSKLAMMSVGSSDLINTFANIPSIDVSLSSLTVTSDNIVIPININTNSNKVSAVQFGFTYDANKIRFDEIQSQLPDGWFIFGTPKDGFIKFGAINKDLKTPVTGEIIPFKLKFTSLVNGLDITTSIKVTSVMDASDDKGNQLGIKVNTSTIKLTGYNNFNK
jgi:hypothetical protein